MKGDFYYTVCVLLITYKIYWYFVVNFFGEKSVFIFLAEGEKEEFPQ